MGDRNWRTTGPLSARPMLLAQLESEPGQHLVIVRYLPGHHTDAEWVYNPADIDRAKVIWARDLGPTRNIPLLDYYKDRHIWLLEVGDWRSPAMLKPWPESP